MTKRKYQVHSTEVIHRYNTMELDDSESLQSQAYDQYDSFLNIYNSDNVFSIVSIEPLDDEGYDDEDYDDEDYDKDCQ